MKVSMFRKTLNLFAVISLFALSGCFLDDSSDGGNTDNAVTIAENDVASGISGMAVEFVSEVITDLPDWLQGFEETGGREFAIEWDGENLRWILSGSENYEDEEASGHVTVHTTIQFLAGGEPMQHPTPETDQIEVTQNATNAGTYEPGDFRVVFDLEANHEISIVATGEEGATITGHGGITGTTETTVNGRTYNGDRNLGWTASLTLGSTGECGTGLVSGNDGDYEFMAQFDGTGAVDITVSKYEATIETDTMHYECPVFDDESTARQIVKLEVIGPEAAELAAIVMSESARWLTGDLGDPDPGRATEPSWDPIEEVWYWTDSFSTLDRTWDAAFKVRYASTGVAQQQPDLTTDAMDVHLFVHVVGSKEREGETITYDLEFDSVFEVTDLGATPYAAHGGGAIRGSIGIPEGNDFGADANWSLSGQVIDSRCPTGEFAVETEDLHFDATFDGSGGMDWEIRNETDEGLSGSTVSLGCGE
jgi:hypothetical protein